MHKKGSDCLCLQCQEKLQERVFWPESQEQELTKWKAKYCTHLKTQGVLDGKIYLVEY